MKKILFLTGFLFFSVFLSAQEKFAKMIPVFAVQDVTTRFGRPMPDSIYIYNIGTGRLYFLLETATAVETLKNVLACDTCYKSAIDSMTTLYVDTLLVGFISVDSAVFVKLFADSAAFNKVHVNDSALFDAAAELYWDKDEYIGRKDANGLVTSGSWTTTDTGFVAVVSATGNILGLGTLNHLSGAGGGAATGVLTLSSNGTPQLVLNDLDAADAQEPMWYMQSANNASKGIFYFGYGDRSSGTVMTGYTDVMLVDASSFTLGSTIGTGTQTLYSGKIVGNDSARVEGSSLFKRPINIRQTNTDPQIILRDVTNDITANIYADSVANLFIGLSSGVALTSGISNTGVGAYTLEHLTTGSYNYAIGTGALESNTTGSNNVAIGNSALVYNVDGSSNVAIGKASLQSNTSGSENVSIGRASQWYNETGTNNVSIGNHSGEFNVTGLSNVTIGDSAGHDNTLSNKLYIENSSADSISALIYGDFLKNWLRLNADVVIKNRLFLIDIPTAATEDTIIGKNINGSLYAIPVATGVLDLDTAVVLFKYDTIPSVASAKIGTRFDVDTLTGSIYDSLNIHWDTLVSHNTRILALKDTAAIHLDSLQSHNTRINTNLDSISAHNTRINNNVDSLAVHLDSLQSHNTRINLNVDSIAAHNTRILALKDSIAVHLDTLQSHNDRINLNLDSITAHNTRINAIIDSLGVHFDTAVAIRSDLNDLTNAVGDTANIAFLDQENTFTKDQTISADLETQGLTVTDSTSAWGPTSEYSTKYMFYQRNIVLYDDVLLTFFEAVHGWGFISGNDGDAFAAFRFKIDGTVTLLPGLSTADVDNADTDTKLCIYDLGTQIGIKNRLGTNEGFLISIHYASTTFP